MDKKTENRLRNIASGKLTESDKTFIAKKSEELGLAFEPRMNCSNCYADQAVLIMRALKGKEEEQKEDERKFVLINGVDVMFRGMRINADTLTDEVAKKAIENGFPLRFFKRYEKQD